MIYILKYAWRFDCFILIKVIKLIISWAYGFMSDICCFVWQWYRRIFRKTYTYVRSIGWIVCPTHRVYWLNPCIPNIQYMKHIKCYYYRCKSLHMYGYPYNYKHFTQLRCVMMRVRSSWTCSLWVIVLRICNISFKLLLKCSSSNHYFPDAGDIRTGCTWRDQEHYKQRMQHCPINRFHILKFSVAITILRSVLIITYTCIYLFIWVIKMPTIFS